jgi:hypothetical protein
MKKRPMSSAELINEIKKDALIKGILCISILLGIIILNLVIFWSSKDKSGIIFLIVLLGISPFAIAIHEFLTYRNPTRIPKLSVKLKINPDYFEMYDLHMSNIVYEDKYVLISDRFISDNKGDYQIAALDEVYMISHEFKKSDKPRTFIPVFGLFGGLLNEAVNSSGEYESIALYHARGTEYIRTGMILPKTANKIMDTISPHCRYAKVTSKKSKKDDLAYCEQMRFMWQQGQLPRV